jgi:hypothetical protein
MYRILFIFFIFSGQSLLAQDIPITEDMLEYSENSLTGVYLCTPRHVEQGDCSDVDPEYFENLAHATLGRYEVGVLRVNGEDTIALNGPLSPGSAANIISFFESHPHITTFVLASPGGSEIESWLLVDYIKENGLNTWVPSKRYCLSACTQVFLAGHQQVLDGLLGFHTGSYYLPSQYPVRNLEAAQETLSNAIYENNQFQLRRVRLFLENEISLDLLDAMNEARGEFLVFENLEDLNQVSNKSDWIMSVEELKQRALSQEVVNFNFESYTPLF